jgi:small subunit ribosomal protein S21
MKSTIVSVEVRGDINKALKEYKRKVIKSGHIIELRNRLEYKKPSVVKREQMQKAKRKNELQITEDKLISIKNKN